MPVDQKEGDSTVISFIIQADMKSLIAHEVCYEENCSKVLFLIHIQCTNHLCVKLESLGGWENIKEDLNMLGLLCDIKTF